MTATAKENRMRHSRRRFLEGAGVAASCLAFGRARLARAESDAARHLAGAFEVLGYQPVKAHPLISGDAFNGGLRYDEMPHDQGAPAKRVYVQPCSRLEDIANRNQPVTLAYFHILAVADEAGMAREELLTQFLGFLVDRVGLDPQRLVLVSTELFEPWRPALESYGLGSHQLVIRPIEQAVRDGQGSGFFGPKGHPFHPESWTASFHYPLRDDAGPSAFHYPLPGYLELGELVFAAGPSAKMEIQEGGFGIERLLAARGDDVPSFERSRQSLLAALEAEARSRGVALPPGYETFRAL
jgi:hypothetical protein